MNFTMEKRALFLLSGLFLFSFVWGMHVVSANAFTDPIVSFFSDWSNGNLSDNVAKYLFTVLLFLIFWAVLDSVKMFEESGSKFNWLIALIVSFLSTAYLVPSDIYLMLISYGALGMTFGGIFPFLLLAFFSVHIHKSSNSAGKVFSKILWFVFIFFLIWKLMQGMYSTSGVGQIGLVEGWTYFGLIVFSILWVFVLERPLVKLIFKEELKDEAEAVGQRMYKRSLADIAKLRSEAKALRESGDISGAKELESQAKAMEKSLGK